MIIRCFYTNTIVFTSHNYLGVNITHFYTSYYIETYVMTSVNTIYTFQTFEHNIFLYIVGTYVYIVTKTSFQWFPQHKYKIIKIWCNQCYSNLYLLTQYLKYWHSYYSLFRSVRITVLHFIIRLLTVYPLFLKNILAYLF